MIPKGVFTTSKYSLFEERWKAGCGHSACERATKICLARGQIPCDVLFVGEAPGPSENILGQPFVGPAGQLQDRIISDAVNNVRFCSVCRKNGRLVRFPSEENSSLCEARHEEKDAKGIRIAFGNVTCCIPLDEDGDKFTEPPDDQVKQCQQRLKEFIEVANPRLIICVGNIASDWLDPEYRYSCKVNKEIPRVQITHPAAILRATVAAKGLMIQRNVIAIRNAVDEHLR
jgi:uracil-DNA glycosylase